MPSKKSKKKDKKLRLVKEKFNEKVPDGLNYGIAQNLPPDAIANVTGLSKEETNLLYETDTDSSKSRGLKKGKGISDAINLSNIDKKYLFPDKLINTGDISSFHVRSWMFEYNQLPPNERREVSDTLDFWKRAGDDKTEDDKSNISHLVAEPQSPSAPTDENLYPDIKDESFEAYTDSVDIQRKKGAILKKTKNDPEPIRPFSPLQNAMINKIYEAEDEIVVVEDQIREAND